MRVLLDTHTFLWFGADDPRLSATAAQIMETGETQPMVSVASLWEITLKVSLGKLALDMTISEMIEAASSERIATLPIAASHLLAYSRLALHHRDPFDRMLVAQALAENLPIVSRDEDLDAYGIQRI